MELKKCILTKNDCYKKGQKINPNGIVVHSTGANNPNLKRYIQPDDGSLGKNTNNNDWNRSGISKCVHAFIGKDKNGDVQVYQTLPFNYACWGVGSGSKGSYNYNPAYIQFEICEDDLTNEDYFTKAFDLAAEFCAYLCNEYNLSIDNIVSHHEAHEKGYGSNHSDCDHWLKKFDKTMDDFRNDVRTKMNSENNNEEIVGNSYIEYTIQKGDTLTEIAKKYNTTVDLLTELNNIANADKIYAGNTLKIPANNQANEEDQEEDFFGGLGYFKDGDTHPNIGKIAKFMREVFPSYTKEAALGNYYGQYIHQAIEEFQRRAKAEGNYDSTIDGYTGPITLESLKKYGFQE